MFTWDARSLRLSADTVNGTGIRFARWKGMTRDRDVLKVLVVTTIVALGGLWRLLG